MRCNKPCNESTRSSVCTVCPASRAWRLQTPAAITTSPRNPRFLFARDEAPDCLGAESGLATLTRRRAAAIGIVGFHDRLHEFVTHHVALIELDERDAFDLADHVHRPDQP